MKTWARWVVPGRAPSHSWEVREAPLGRLAGWVHRTPWRPRSLSRDAGGAPAPGRSERAPGRVRCRGEQETLKGRELKQSRLWDCAPRAETEFRDKAFGWVGGTWRGGGSPAWG